MVYTPDDCEYYFLPLNPACSTTTSTTSTSTSTTTTSTTTIAPTTTSTTSTTSTTTTSTTTTLTPTTTTTSTTQIPQENYCLYWEDTNIVHRVPFPLLIDNIYLTTSLLGVYIDSRDNILYGGDTTFYTNYNHLTWNLNRTGWYVEFIIDGVTYGPYIYDVIAGVGSQLLPGQLGVDKSYVVYDPPSEIQLFGSLQFHTTPYYGTLDPTVLTIGAGDGMRIYKDNCDLNLLLT